MKIKKLIENCKLKIYCYLSLIFSEITVNVIKTNIHEAKKITSLISIRPEENFEDRKLKLNPPTTSLIIPGILTKNISCPNKLLTIKTTVEPKNPTIAWVLKLDINIPKARYAKPNIIITKYPPKTGPKSGLPNIYTVTTAGIDKLITYIRYMAQPKNFPKANSTSVIGKDNSSSQVLFFFSSAIKFIDIAGTNIENKNPITAQYGFKSACPKINKSPKYIQLTTISNNPANTYPTGLVKYDRHSFFAIVNISLIFYLSP